MEIEHRAFLKKHYINYETALSGYVRNLDLPILKMYEHIYRTYLNPTFVLTIWCAGCRMEMIMRLYAYYVSLPIENKIIEVVEPEQVIIKKTRNKKNG
jgi:hypothetical protein